MIHFKRKTPKISLPLYMYDRLMDNDGIRFDTEVVCETKARRNFIALRMLSPSR